MLMPLKNSRTGWPSVSPVTYSTPLMIRLLRFFRAALSSVHSGLNPDITAVRLVVSILSSASSRLMVLNNRPPNATVKPTIKPSLYLTATSPRDDRQSWREPDFRYVSVRKFYHTIVRTHEMDGGRISDTRPPCRRGAASDCSSARAIGCPQGPPHQGEPRADASAAGSSAALWDEAAVGCVQKNRGETNIANNKTVPEEDFADRM